MSHPSDQVRWAQVRHHWEIYLFIIPTLVTIGLFVYYPAASGIFHSFFRWNGSDVSEFVGFENYADLVKSTAFWRSFQNAFLLGLWNVAKMLPALLVALCIHRCRNERLQFIYRALFVIPMVVPPLVVVLVWRSFFFEATSGYLNQFISWANLQPFLNTLAPLFGWGDTFAGGARPAWLGDPRLIFTAVVLWGFPWVGSLAVLTYLAKLQTISKDVYEAGEIDGVNWFTKFTKIELPLITGSIYIMLVFAIIGTITDAGTIMLLGGFEGGPGARIDVPALFMLRKAFVENRMGYACAVGIVLMLIVMTLQKCSTLITEWEHLSPRKRLGVRLAGLAAGLGLIASGSFAAIGALLVLAGLPYEWIARWLPRRSAMPAVSGGSVGDEKAAKRRDREEAPLNRKLSDLRDVLLRCTKHGTIWAVLFFAFLPLYLMLIVSFKSNKQFYTEPAVLTAPLHAENWKTAWDLVTPTLANSLCISIGSTLLTLFFALLAAYFFSRKRMPMSGFLWNAILVLMMLPMIANLVPLFRLLKDLNLLNTLAALILVGASQGQIFAIFMLRNFISDIPRDLYEAAEIDGANHFQQMYNVVLPLSGPILGTVGVMHFMTAWNEFVLPLIVMRDHTRLPVMVQLIRLAGEYIKLWGPLMAGYAMAAVPIILLFLFSMKLFVKGMTEGAVKG